MNCNEKRRYQTRQEALRDLRRIQSAPRAHREAWPAKEGYPPGSSSPRRVYRCPLCRGYHLTSQA